MKRHLLFLFLGLSSSQILPAQDSAAFRSPYNSVNWGTDGLTFGTGIAVAFIASAIDDTMPVLTLNEISALDKNSINAIDRISAGNYSHTQSKISDVLVGASILSPALLMLDPAIRKDAGTISTMYLETVLFATFTPSLGKGSAKRIRPYVYSTSAPLSLKQDDDSRRSFFSGHSTWAFATSVFFASVYTDYHPDSEYKKYIWGGAFGLASTVAILRVTSGAHFISDVVVGAAVGSAIGYGIPYLHRTISEDVTVSPVLGPDYRGIHLSLHLK
ncbi:MAG: phosphatase PAP2 family protein [Bacteroidota bacterium]